MSAMIDTVHHFDAYPSLLSSAAIGVASAIIGVSQDF